MLTRSPASLSPNTPPQLPSPAQLFMKNDSPHGFQFTDDNYEEAFRVVLHGAMEKVANAKYVQYCHYNSLELSFTFFSTIRDFWALFHILIEMATKSKRVAHNTAFALYFRTVYSRIVNF